MWICLEWALPGYAATDLLARKFRDPPRDYSMFPLWSWNSTLTRERLTWQIDQMVEQGVYGAFMHTRAGLNESATPYFSDGFWEGVRVSVDHAAKAGFQAWIYDEDRWPSGAAGGRTLRANPERFTATGLEHESRVIDGPIRIPVSFAGAKFVSAARLTEANRIDPSTLVDLGGLQEWNAPPGRWHVCILRPRNAPYPLPNYINPDAVREFLDNTHEQYAARFGKHFGKTIPGVFFDEISNIPLAWDPLLAQRFRQAKGYDLEKVLPLLWHDGDARTIRVRCDYFDVLTKLYEEAWFRQIADWCARHNLKLTGHTNETLRHIRGQGDYFRTWRHAQIPGTDNEDFRYTFPRQIGAWKPKQLSSVSHLYGTERAAAEALGGAGWPITLEETRYGVNMLAAYGINFYTFHLFHYAMDTPQSMDDWPNSWFYQNPYWKYFKKLADHVRRVSFMGSQGTHVADVAVLYPVEEIWSHGMPQEEFADDRAPVVGLIDRLMREQIDCDVVDTDSILRAEPAGDGRVRIGAETYRALILPDVATVSLAAYQRIAGLARGGVKVLAMGRTPRHSAENGGDDPKVGRISAALLTGRAPRDVDEVIGFLRREVPADVRVLSGPAGALRYLHRRVDGREMYWLVNSERAAVELTVQLAAKGPAERWDAETGAITPFPALDQSAGQTRVRLRLKPWEAFYLVFNPAGRPVLEAARKTRPPSLPPVDLNGDWSFQVAPSELDSVWKPDPGETRVEAPLVEARIVRQPDVEFWRRVKVADPLSPRRGAARYLTPWDAYWVTRYTYQTHFGDLGGPEIEFRATFDLDFQPERSWLAIAADERFECSVNGARIASGDSVTVDSLPLKRGRNVIDIRVRGKGYLLAQGEVAGKDGRRLLRTDRSWQVRLPGGEWTSAYEFASPPFGAWGDVPLRGGKQTLPATVWYRVAVPPGARFVEPPKVRGAYELFLDAMPVPAGKPIAIPPSARLRTVALKVRVEHPEDGLQEPLVFRCGPAPAAPGDWRDLGLDWYSGRGVYRTSFRLPDSYAGRKLVLDLGDLRYTGEVWLNGRLAGSLAWPPYEADISRFARAGENDLVVVVANLLANQMRWNIFDSAIPSQYSRWWHDGNILREADHLRSGLLGPVRIRAAEDE